MKFFARIYQFCIKVASIFLPWREPKLIVGQGSLKKLPEVVKNNGVDNILIVTDDTLVKLGLLDGLFIGCKESGVKFTLFDKVVPNPTVDNIEEGLALYKQNHCAALVAFGGGSSMDCAKGIGARVARPDKTIPQMKGILKVGKPLPLLFAVPTTAGTGSETTLAAVITDVVTHYKFPINDPVLFPDYAVLDPLVTVKLPPHITSTTGMDALCHAVEAYIGKSNTAKTKRMALDAIKIIDKNLYDAFIDGDNLKAREQMQIAAYDAGVAFTRAYVGYVHAIAHSLGGQYGVPHGLANAVVMPYVFRYYGKSAQRKLAELAMLINKADGSDSRAVKAEKFIAWIEEMNEKMNIPSVIPQIMDSDIPTLVVNAYSEGVPLYPTPKIFTKKDFATLYSQIKG